MNEEQSAHPDDKPFLLPKQIKDKRHRKPKDWVDEAPSARRHSRCGGTTS